MGRVPRIQSRSRVLGAGLAVGSLLVSLAPTRAESAVANAGEPEVRLTGIVSVGPVRSALLEVVPAPGRAVVRPILAVGERLPGVEVVSIDEARGAVGLRIGGRAAMSTPLEGAHAGTEARTLQLAGADLMQVIDVYQRLAGRTVIRDEFPGARINLVTGALSEAEAVKVLEAEFNRLGLVAAPVADKFVCVTSHGLARVDTLPPQPGAGAAPTNDETLPPGMMKFDGAHPAQVLDIYQELAGVTLLAAPNLVGSPITVRSQSELTRAEATWLLRAVLYLGGIEVVPHGPKFAVVRPRGGTNTWPELTAARGDGRLSGTLPPGMLRFQETDPAAVLAVYAELCERAVAPQAPAGAAPRRWPGISISSRTELTRTEALHALDVLAALRGFEFAPVGERELTIQPRRGPKAKPPAATEAPH